MINDKDTNKVYFSNLLEEKHKKFAHGLYNILIDHGIAFAEIKHTKDIWCRDYMPVQVNNEEAIQFKFQPSYLNFKKYAGSKTDVSQLLFNSPLKIKNSDIILDGGNIVRYDDTAILTVRVLKENNKPKVEILSKLKELLEVERVIFIPELPKDASGHADGMIRFIDKNNVLVNDYINITSKVFCSYLLKILHENDLKITLLPNAMGYNKSYNDATGDYNNFLQINNLIIVPLYGYSLDKIIIDVFKRNFEGSKIEGIKANEISRNGGVLNCISWTIRNSVNNQ